MKKKTLVPFVIFLLGICLVSLIVYITDTHENEQRHITAQLNATTYGERIKNEITDGIEIMDDLKQILISENGEIRQFETIAENLMSDSIESVFPVRCITGKKRCDEFSILLPNCTFEEADVQLQQFAKLPKTFCISNICI